MNRKNVFLIAIALAVLVAAGSESTFCAKSRLPFQLLRLLEVMASLARQRLA